MQTSSTCTQFGQQMCIYCASSLRCEILATAAWRRLKPRALIMWARLLLLGCSLEVAVEGSSHLRMKTPGNSSDCCCCCWCEESKYLYLLLLLLLIMWRVLVLSGLVATLLLRSRRGVLHGRTTTLLRSRRKRAVETRGPNFERPGGPSLRPHKPYYTLVLGSFLPTCSKRQVSYLSGTFGGPFSGSLKNTKTLEFRSLWRTFPGGINWRRF